MTQYCKVTERLLPAPAARSGSVTGGWLGRFWSDRSGSMSFMAVAGALVMMVFGGIGIDMIHAELKRTKVQNTLDRAVLAAASLDNTIAPGTTVDSYFAAMGMSDSLQSVAVSLDTATAREVRASARMTMPSNFMELLGVDTLQAEGQATATNVIRDIEISLVLDISGSMSGTKIQQLKDAAKGFVGTVLADGDENVTVSMVPYNATVNLGPTLSPYFNLAETHDYSHCAIFPDSAFGSTALDTAQQLQRLAHFDLWSNSLTTAAIPSPWCATGDGTAMMVHSDSISALNARIDSFAAGGNTAIDLGMKWGLALLDPSMRDTISTMIGDGVVPASAADRPFAYGDPEKMKFVVVITDGANTTEYDLKAAAKIGNSEVWIDDRGTASPSDDRFSLRVKDLAGTDNDVYFWKRYEGSSLSYRYRNTPDGAAAARQMTNAELYARFGTPAVANGLYHRPYADGQISYTAYREAYYVYESIVNADQADARLSSVCAAGRDQGVVVYAVGVEAPERGLAAMRDCASSDAHYFDVQGDQLDETFDSIARTLTSLRLTQ